MKSPTSHKPDEPTLKSPKNIRSGPAVQFVVPIPKLDQWGRQNSNHLEKDSKSNDDISKHTLI